MKLLPVFAALLALAGCIVLPISHDVRRTPTVYGTVRDAVTGAPIPDAQVQIAEVPHDATQAARDSEVQSAADGSFSVDVRERKGWFVMMLLGDFFGKCESRLTVTKSGYITYTETPTGSGDAHVDMNSCAGLKIQRDIALQPAPAQ